MTPLYNKHFSSGSINQFITKNIFAKFVPVNPISLDWTALALSPIINPPTQDSKKKLSEDSLTLQASPLN